MSDSEWVEDPTFKTPGQGADWVDDPMFSPNSRSAVNAAIDRIHEPIDWKKAIGTAADSASDVLTMGLAPHIETMLEGALPGTGKPFSQAIPGSPEYIDRRDQLIDAYNKEKRVNPIADKIGTGAGILGSALTMPALGSAEGAGLLAKLGSYGGIGAAAGALQNPGDVKGEVNPLQLGDRLVNAGIGAVAGAGLGMAGDAIAGKLSGTAKSVGSLTKEKPNADAIRQAAKEMGTEVTPGMTSDSEYIQHLEKNLSESPSIMGQSIAKKYDNVWGTSNDAVKEALTDASPLTPFQIGEKAKSGMTAQVAEQSQPLSMVFDQVRDQTKNMPIFPDAVADFKNSVAQSPELRLLGGPKADWYVKAIDRAQNANELKTLMTGLNADIQASQGSERIGLQSLKSAMSELEQRTMNDAATTLSAKAGAGPDAASAQTTLENLQGARKGWAQMMGNLQDTSQDARLGKIHDPTSFLDKVEAIPSERIQDRFFNVDNQRQIQNLQQNFPNEFSLLRQGKLAEIQSAAGGPDNLSAARFIREIGKMNPEAQQAILGQEGVQNFNNMRTLTKSLPPLKNTSRTAHEQEWKQALLSNLKDIPNYLTYKAVTGSGPETLQNALMRSSEFSRLATTNPQAFGALSHGIRQNFSSMKNPANQSNANQPVSEQEAQQRFIQGN